MSMEPNGTQNVLIVGVGGQGVILASDILGVVCMNRGYQVKKSEVHGMAKRGGVVYSHVRYGAQVLSPTIEPGTSDVLLAFEPAEALRWSKYVKPGGTIIVNSRKRIPPAACQDRRMDAPTRYPQGIEQALRGQVADVRQFDAEGLAVEIGDHRMCNTVLLGALSSVCEFEVQDWLGAISASVKPKTVERNQKAFLAGRNAQFPAAHNPLPPETAAMCRSVTYLDAPAIDIHDSWCKGCEICVVVCPQACLKMNERNRAEVVKAEACIRCMLCEWMCPDLAVRVQ
jgi:indolepyruvate ferredoxin oxidoreductase beta subunit